MAAAASNTDSPVSGSVASTYTFSASALGSAAADRVIAVIASCYDSDNGTPTISSMTIGGVSATFRARGFGDADVCTELWTALVPTGTTGDVVVNWSTTVDRCGAGVFRIVGAEQVPFATATNGGSGNLSTTINIPDQGSVLAAIGGVRGAGAFTATWAGVTENYDEVISGGACHSGGCVDLGTAETGRTISATFSASPDFGVGLMVASWGPALGQPTVKRFGGVPFASPNRGVW